MPRVYVYDDSFDGLLTALFTAYCATEKPDTLSAESEFEDGLFIEKTVIASDRAKAANAMNVIANFISLEAMHNIFYAFLAESDNHGGVIYDYFNFGVEKGRLVDKFLHDPRVIAVHRLRDRLHCEKHRLMGLIRFKKVEGAGRRPLYYAECEPDNNVIGLLAPHFAHRLPGERWMIHDLKRGVAVVNDPDRKSSSGLEKQRGASEKTWSLVDVTLAGTPENAHQEELYQDLWREFIRSIAIQTRINPKLQRRCMPARYWKYLTEMQAPPRIPSIKQ